MLFIKIYVIYVTYLYRFMFAYNYKKIYMSIKFNNKRVDDLTTTFPLFTSQVRLCFCFLFFCNFYIIPYFSNISFDIVLKLQKFN